MAPLLPALHISLCASVLQMLQMDYAPWFAGQCCANDEQLLRCLQLGLNAQWLAWRAAQAQAAQDALSGVLCVFSHPARERLSAVPNFVS